MEQRSPIGSAPGGKIKSPGYVHLRVLLLPVFGCLTFAGDCWAFS